MLFTMINIICKCDSIKLKNHDLHKSQFFSILIFNVFKFLWYWPDDGPW
jgi:hypothetical protein